MPARVIDELEKVAITREDAHPPAGVFAAGWPGCRARVGRNPGMHRGRSMAQRGSPAGLGQIAEEVLRGHIAAGPCSWRRPSWRKWGFGRGQGDPTTLGGEALTLSTTP